MLSRDLLRERPDEVKARLADRNVDLELVDRWTELDGERRSLLVETEASKQQRNEASKRIGEKKRTGADAADEIAAVGALKDRIERARRAPGEIDASLHEIELQSPEPSRRRRADRRRRERQPRRARGGRAARLRLRAAHALGPRHGARHPRLRARGEARRARASPSTAAPRRGSSARSRPSCSTCTPSSTATPR